MLLEVPHSKTSARRSIHFEPAITFTELPRSDGEHIAAEATYETELELADGRLVPRKLGLAEIQIADVRGPVLPAVGDDRENLYYDT
jgi:hypothetical protein